METCRDCSYLKLRWCGSEYKTYCSLIKSNKTIVGLKPMKKSNIACDMFEEKQRKKHELGMMAYKNWDEDEIKTALKLRAEGKQYKEIGFILGRPWMGVRHIVLKQKIKKDK